MNQCNSRRRLIEWSEWRSTPCPSFYASETMEYRLRREGHGVLCRSSTPSNGPTPGKAEEHGQWVRMDTRAREVNQITSRFDKLDRVFCEACWDWREPGGMKPERVLAEMFDVSRERVRTWRATVEGVVAAVLWPDQIPQMMPSASKPAPIPVEKPTQVMPACKPRRRPTLSLRRQGGLASLSSSPAR